MWKPAKEELQTINVVTEESQRELKIATLVTRRKERLNYTTEGQRDYIDVFARCHEDMHGLDIIVYRVSLKKDASRLRKR